MPRSFFAFGSAAIVVVGMLVGCEKPNPSGLIGTTAPSFTVSPFAPTGDVKLSDLKGKVVVLDFWATWCGPCKMLMPHLSALQSKFGPKGLVVMGITADNPMQVMQFKAQYPNLHFGLFADHALDGHNKYHADALPTTVVIDRQGKIQYWDQGFDEDSFKDMSGQIENLLNG